MLIIVQSGTEKLKNFSASLSLLLKLLIVRGKAVLDDFEKNAVLSAGKTCLKNLRGDIFLLYNKAGIMIKPWIKFANTRHSTKFLIKLNSIAFVNKLLIKMVPKHQIPIGNKVMA